MLPSYHTAQPRNGLTIILFGIAMDIPSNCSEQIKMELVATGIFPSRVLMHILPAVFFLELCAQHSMEELEASVLISSSEELQASFLFRTQVMTYVLPVLLLLETLLETHRGISVFLSTPDHNC